MKRILFFILALVLVLFSTGSLAEIPRIVNYQGLLLGADEAPVPEGNYKITFRIRVSIQTQRILHHSYHIPPTPRVHKQNR